MGRKIPGKKHKGVKDPYQQQVNRHAIVKDKINTAPADINEDQPLPERLQNIIQWQELARQGSEKKRRKRGGKDKNLVDSRRLEDKEETLRGMTRADKPTPAFIQLAGETDRQFLRRVDELCEEVVKESEFANKFKIDLTTNAETEEEMAETRKQRGNVENIMNAGGKKKTKKQKKEEEPQLTKKERVKMLLTAKKQAKLDKVQEKLDESNRFRDVVAFGDIVHAPPVLTIPLRSQAKKSIESKPGRREGLLLHKLLKDDRPSQVSSKSPANGMKKKNKKTKLRDLPIADQRMQELNRIKAVEAYRNLKSKGSNAF